MFDIDIVLLVNKGILDIKNNCLKHKLVYEVIFDSLKWTHMIFY